MRKYRSDDENITVGRGQGSSLASKAPKPKEAFMQFLEQYNSLAEVQDTSFAEQSQTVEEEFNNYIITAPKYQVALDPIKFWEVSICPNNNMMSLMYIKFKTNRETFPTIFKIALDYLPIQASSVPCERVFSSSAETDTNKRNRIKADLMEALQLLKYAYKKERLNFTADLLTAEEDLMGSLESAQEDELSEQLLKSRASSSVNESLFTGDWDF